MWSPQFKKDATVIENVQRRATRMVPEIAKLDYESRLRALKLPSLTFRRMRGDLIETYKYFHDLYKVSHQQLLPLDTNTSTRGHRFKLAKQSCKLDVRKNFFSLRVRDVWNSLPESVVTAPTINMFKNGVDRYFGDLKFSADFPLNAHKFKSACNSEDLLQASS